MQSKCARMYLEPQSKALRNMKPQIKTPAPFKNESSSQIKKSHGQHDRPK